MPKYVDRNTSFWERRPLKPYYGRPLNCRGRKVDLNRMVENGGRGGVRGFDYFMDVIKRPFSEAKSKIPQVIALLNYWNILIQKFHGSIWNLTAMTPYRHNLLWISQTNSNMYFSESLWEVVSVFVYYCWLVRKCIEASVNYNTFNLF